jgi:hypothetical protein
MPAAFAVSVLFAACSSTPITTSQLDQARRLSGGAKQSSVAASAPLEFKAAADALDRANAAAAKKESLNEIDKLAYIAKQKIATAQEAARAKQAEAMWPTPAASAMKSAWKPAPPKPTRRA